MDTNPTAAELYKIVEIVDLSDKVSPEQFETEIQNLAKENSSSTLEEMDPTQVPFLIQSWLLNKEKAFLLDWKWTPEDLLFNIQRLIPEFTYEIEKLEEDDANDRFDLKIKVMDETIEKTADYDKLGEFGDPVNDIVFSKFGKIFVPYETGGDDYGLILISNDKFNELEDYHYLSYLG